MYFTHFMGNWKLSFFHLFHQVSLHPKKINKQSTNLSYGRCVVTIPCSSRCRPIHMRSMVNALRNRTVTRFILLVSNKNDSRVLIYRFN